MEMNDHSACLGATLSTPRCHNSSVSLLTVIIDVATDAMLAIDQMAVLLPGRQVCSVYTHGTSTKQPSFIRTCIDPSC
jgi:hypothetical protein